MTWSMILSMIAIGLVGAGIFIGIIILIRSLVEDVKNHAWGEFAIELVFLGIVIGVLAGLAYALSI